MILILYCTGLAAANGTEISGEVYAWVVVFILPVNSAINPILYTLSTINLLQVQLVYNIHSLELYVSLNKIHRMPRTMCFE